MILPPTIEVHCCQAETEQFPRKMIYTSTRDPASKGCRRESYVRLRVTFETDEDNQIRVLTAKAASPSTLSSSVEDQNTLWWSRAEIKVISKRERAACDFYRQSDDDYSDQVRHIFSRCSTSATNKSDAQLLAARSSNRGLEQGIVNMFHLRRRKVIEGVLDQQTKVAHLSPLKRQQMIRSKSAFLSSPTKTFALVVGAADAMIALAVLEENIRDLVTLDQLSARVVLVEETSLSSSAADSWQWGESFRKQSSHYDATSVL